MKAPNLPQQYDAAFLQKLLNDLYRRIDDIQPKSPKFIGTPSGKEYTIYVDDSTSPSVKAK